ncbi:hypothetical protein [Planococcus sp. ISL-110]|uniref:hypothetical protein n=1 Tax=Planococcus sp. ISL-110 TaxID=2819167 RepID=UPI001BE59AC1|nr:hypothetical protein [Planococcus sp. ISL-110]MBT2571452.1 hypothetical protein [Planococcus sp. ISL-110]
MKKTMLMLCLLLAGQAQAYGTHEKPAYSNMAVSEAASAVLLQAQFERLTAARFPTETELLDGGKTQQGTAIHHAVIKTQIAGASTAETKKGLAKADLDEEAGRVDWGTAIIILCVAFLVYLINRKKR